MRSTWIDIVGRTFGRWTVLRAVKGSPERQNQRLICKCVCGKEKEVKHMYLVRGESRSCGCLRDQKTVERSYRHGRGLRGNRDVMFSTYHDILKRCKFHPRYQPRGIAMCDRWKNGEGGLTGLECFIADMGERPEGLTIERINNNGPYSPDNCRWANRLDQANNKCNNTILKWNGISMTLPQWARKLGFPQTALKSRRSAGWSVHEMLSTPLCPTGTRRKQAEEDWC